MNTFDQSLNFHKSGLENSEFDDDGDYIIDYDDLYDNDN